MRFVLKKIICFLYALILFALCPVFLSAREKLDSNNNDDDRWGKPSFYQEDWNKLSKLEKEISVLTSVWMEKYGFDYCNFLCKRPTGVRYSNSMYANVTILLSEEWGVKNKDSLLKKIKEEEESSFHTKYLSNCQLLDKYSDLTPAQIVMQEKLNISDAGRLFYAYDVRSKVGSHGFEAYSIAKNLLLLRMAFASGFITSEELNQLAQPLVQKALQDYSSFEDFAGHYTAGRACYTITLYKYNRDVDYEINAWKDAKKYLPLSEIPFTGENADKSAVMTIDDAIYTPSEYTAPLIKLERMLEGETAIEGLNIINECYEKYGELSFINQRFSYVRARQFDKNGKESPSDFFEKEYRSFWNSLSEIEQFAIACTSNVFERNGQFHLDFANRILFDKKTTKGKEILNKNWEIFNYEDLMENYKELAEGEQNNLYLELKELIEKNPDSTFVELGIRDNLNITAVSRMYYIQDKNKVLGSHAIEAWIDARMISIIRWAIGAGYISREEAITLITPVVKKIMDDYRSFDEFIAHWIAGYCFNAVYDSTCPECTKELVAAIKSARAYIPFEELHFTGKNADKNHILTIEEAVYNPSVEAAKMIPIQKAYKRYRTEEPSESIYKDFLEAEKLYPEAKNLDITYIFSLLNGYAGPEERVAYTEEKMDLIKDKENYEELYESIVRIYCNDLLRLYQVEKFLEFYKNLPVKLQKDDTIYYCYGYAYYLMIKKCDSIFERDIYISRAKNVFNQLKQMGSSIGDMEMWLRQIEAQ